MISAEILSIKLQELLGKDYFICPLFLFNSKYTTAKETQDGLVQVYNSEYAELRKNKIIGVVSTSNSQRANVDYYYLSASFSIDFSVPFTSDKFNFFKDYEKLIKDVFNKKLEFVNGIYGKMTMQEPVFRAQESDGQYMYNIYTITGTVVLTDSAKFGSDYSVELLVDNEYVKVDGILQYNETLNLNSNTSMNVNSILIKNEPSQSGWAVVFSIEDLETENKARKLIYDIIHNNKEIINENADTELNKRKVSVRLANGREFKGIMSVGFNTEYNGIGVYSISIVVRLKK